MAGVVWFSTVARRLAAATDYRRDGTGPKIPQAQELLQQLGSIGLQGVKRIGHVWGSFLSVSIRSELCHKKKKSARSQSYVVHPTIGLAIEAGAVGCNLEDSFPADGRLREPA